MCTAVYTVDCVVISTLYGKRDKRDIIYLITTKNTDETTEIRRRTGCIIKKPLAVEDYNVGKSFIDRSD